MKLLDVVAFCEICRKDSIHIPAHIQSIGPKPGEWTGISRCKECGEINESVMAVHPVY